MKYIPYITYIIVALIAGASIIIASMIIAEGDRYVLFRPTESWQYTNVFDKRDGVIIRRGEKGTLISDYPNSANKIVPIIHP